MRHERRDWEIAWNIHLQVAATYLGRDQRWFNACKVSNPIALINSVIAKANSLVARHGVPGCAALTTAAPYIRSLRDGAPSGIVPVVAGTRTDERISEGEGQRVARAD